MPSQYPTPDIGGPQYSRCQIIDKKYPVTAGPKYTDGGQDTVLGNSTPSEIIWEIEHPGMSQAEIAVLDAHNDSAFDTHLQFTFRDPETETLWGGVKYLEYQRGTRDMRWSDKRVTRLIKRP